MARQRHAINGRKAVRNILTYFDRATVAEIASGARWYGEARREAADLAAWCDFPLEVTAAILAHLSPQTRWEDNKRHAWELLAEDVKPSGAIGDNVARARKALTAYYAGEDPLSTFGPRAHKTRRFATAIIDGGTGTSVVIDIWAARAALLGTEYRFRDTDQQSAVQKALRRVGVYGQLEDAYRAAARTRGVPPCTAQAVTWGVIRGGWD